MKLYILLFISLFPTLPSFAQKSKVEQWKAIVSQGKKDTTSLIAIDSLCNWYGSHRTDSGIYYIG